MNTAPQYTPPPKKDPAQELVDDLQRLQRRQSWRAMEVNLESNADALAVAETLKAKGFWTAVSGYGKGSSVTVHCEPQELEAMVSAGFATGGRCRVDGWGEVNVPTSDPLKESTWFEPRRGMSAMAEDIDNMRSGVQKLK